MSYTPTEWSTGDTITAALLNKMENGIAAGGGISYDFMAKMDDDGVVEYVSGDFASVVEKIEDCDLVTAMLWAYYFDGGEGTCTPYTPTQIGYNGTNIWIDFGTPGVLVWASDDSVYWDD